MEKRIVLSGIKHCGKSTLGRHLADRWGIPFFDSDEELESLFAERNRRHLATREIFRSLGEEAFRQLEAEVLQTLAESGGDRVVALGGGAVSNRFLAPDTLARLGKGVWLDIRPEIAFERVMRNGLPPFLAGAADPFQEYCRINREREADFRKFARLTFPIATEIPSRVTARMLAEMIEQEEENHERKHIR